MESNKILLVILIATAFLTLESSQATLYQGFPSFNLTQFTYSPNQTIEGFLNFSLTNEPANNIIKATISKAGVPSTTKEMSIQDFLTNSSVTFNCSQNCLVDYSTTGSPQNSISEPIGVGEKYYGLVVTGMNPEVLNLTFKVSGDNAGGNSVCGESPIRMDLLDDGTIDYEFAKPSDEWCSDLRSSDCFSSPTQETELETTPFCQEIFINKTGKLNVSAKLRFDSKNGEESPSYDDIEFYVYDENGNKKGNCSVEYFDSETYDLASCEMSSLDEDENPTGFYIDKADNYFVCIRLSTAATTTYYIRKESDSPVCGIYGTPNPSQEYTEDYEIYIKEAKFAPFDGESIFNEQTKIGDLGLLDYVNKYIETRYNGNCTDRCIIPMKFISRVSQDIMLSDLELEYQSPKYSPTKVYSFYKIQANQPKINLTRQSIPLTAININAPEEQGQNYRIGIQYNNAISLGSILFKVEPVPIIQSISPLTAIPEQSTTFTVVVLPSEGGQIMNYTWDFGDNSAEQTTTIPRASHIYSLGTFNLLVKATDSLGRIGTKIFIINTSLSEDALNASYLRKKQLYSNLSSLQLDWYRDFVYNDSQINNSLFLIQEQLNSANPDLNSIKTSLDSLKIPVSISTSFNVPESSYIPDTQKINLDYLSDLGAGTYSDPDSTKNSIGVWQNDVSFSLGLTVKRITFDDNSNQEISLVTIRTNSQDDIYSVFELPSSVSPNQVKIKENLEAYTGFSNALGFNSSGSFLATLALPLRTDISSINFYSSPAFSSLPSNNNNNNPVNKSSSILFPIIVAVLVIIIVIVVLVLIWKNKSSSSSSLNSDSFENPADEYNLISYIQSSLSQGKSKPEIEQELIGQGWTKKQINSAFKNKDNQNIEPEPAFNY